MSSQGNDPSEAIEFALRDYEMGINLADESGEFDEDEAESSRELLNDARVALGAMRAAIAKLTAERDEALRTPSAALLSELQALLDASYSGEWYVEETDDFWELYAVNDIPGQEPPFNVGHPFKIAKCPKRGQSFSEYWPRPNEAELIVKLRNAAPQLLAAARRCDELEESNTACDEDDAAAAAEQLATFQWQKDRIRELEQRLQDFVDGSSLKDERDSDYADAVVHVTAGMVRRARAALAPPEESNHGG